MHQNDIGEKLSKIRAFLHPRLPKLPVSFPKVALFLSVSDGEERARVVGATGGSLEEAWKKGTAALQTIIVASNLKGRWIRVDWVEDVQGTSWRDLRTTLAQVKRNYFRYGLALDKDLRFAFTEQELNANAMLYGGNSVAHAVVNEKNFALYAKAKFQSLPSTAFKDEEDVFILSTKGVFCGEDGELLELSGTGLDAGRRRVEQLTAGDVLPLIRNSSDYLAQQVNEDGSFVYGYHPCFDRRIEAYNALRHASTTYSMVEAWEVTRDAALKGAIERSLTYLTGTLIRCAALPSGSEAAFLVDVGDEIKLGANAVAILALTKYTAVTGTDAYLPLAEKLAEGIQFMQNREDGSFVHVLNYPDLSVKERFRTIYYDGEAAFGLMRLYDLTQNPSLLETVEKAFEHFIANNHWQHHDHWLSYCVNELTRYRPDERYYRFGIRNFASYLDFVLERITAFPTLLELMMAAEGMITGIRERPEYCHLLDEIELNKFYKALHVRAHYLLNGHFWPELAMYYRNPDRIVGSFFIRHHAFRVRIDDVEHYLSGFVAYRKFLLGGGTPAFLDQDKSARPQLPSLPDPASIGFLMYPESPQGFLEIRKLAEKSAKKGLKVFYASYKNAQVNDGKLNGFVFEKGLWKNADFDIPAIVENAPPRKTGEIALFDRLSSVAFLTCQKLGGKQKTLSLLEADPMVRGWLIPSTTLSADNLEAALNGDGKVIIKPYRSNRGRGVHLLQKGNDGTVSVRTNGSIIQLSAEELRAFVERRSNGNWMLQKYVASTDANGRAFDIRVPMFRSEGGVWRAARIYARLGAGDITSNLATGGSSHDAAPFLSELYGEDTARALVETLERASQQIAQALQEHYPFLIDALGCDFGIAGGQAYLFEVNSYPGMKGCLESATDLKADYYAALSQPRRKAGGVVPTNTLETLGLFDLQRPFAEVMANKEADYPIAIEAATEANRALLQKVMERGENDFSSSQFLKPGMGNPAYALIRSEARRRGYRSKIVNNTHLEIRDDYGVVAVFSPNSPNLSCAPREVAANKKLTKAILREAGLPTPAGSTFTDYDAGLRYVLQRGRPQVVKPIRGYGGIGVTTRVTTEEQFRRAWERASRGKRRIVVEDFFVGDELRLIVLGGETVAAVCRVPAYVVGDGVNSISKLVEMKNVRRAKNPLMRVYPIQQFDYLQNELGLGLDYVPAHGQFVRLSTVSNVGLGGEAVSLVDVVHPSFLELARRAFGALPGATQLGLDVIAKDFAADAFDDNATIIEVNSDPAIGTPRFAAYGPPASDIARKLFDYVERRKPLRNPDARAGAVCEPASVYDVRLEGTPFQGNPRLQTQLLRDAAARRGLDVKAPATDVTIVSRGGKRRLFWLGMSDRTPMAARRASRDLEWSSRLLREAGIATPERQTFGLDDFDQAWSFADRCDGSVSVKSADSASGYMAGTNIGSFPDFQSAWNTAIAVGAPRIAVERQYTGQAYRLFVIENRLVAVTLRHIGGRSTAMVAKASSETGAPRRSLEPAIGAVTSTGHCPTLVEAIGSCGAPLPILDVQVSHSQIVTDISGNGVVDETKRAHPEWAEIAVRAKEAIFDPHHAGIDLFAEDIGKPPEQQKWFVAGIKVNPEFFIHQFPMRGQGRDVAAALLESLF